MCKILVLNGSPRGRHGNTHKLIEKFLEGLKEVEEGLEIEYIEIRNKNIKDCTGCFSCWNKTPGKCVHKDDMDELLEKFIIADTIIWATPLYHYTMTSILKRFIERTLPINEPYIVKKGNVFGHPERYSTREKKNILISNCGFPEHHNFEVMVAEFKKITGDQICEKILCVQGELLSVKSLENKIKWYLEEVKKAGREFKEKGYIKEHTSKLLKEPLIPIEDFIEMANLSWQIEGETAPTLKTALGEDGKKIKGTRRDSLKGYNFLKLMQYSFNAINAKNMDVILAFDFTDLKEEHYFMIQDGKCTLKKGKSDHYTTKIITTYETWRKISSGELDGGQAMLEGLYRIDGDLGLMMHLGKLFGSNIEEKSKEQDEKSNEVLGINGEKWMVFSFIPWIFSWIFINQSLKLGIVLPLCISIGIIAKKKKEKALTYFEKTNVLYFTILLIVALFEYEVFKNKGSEINYFAMAFIWLHSIFISKPLTAGYSKYRYDISIENNPIFIKTNNILTLFWSGIFFIQGITYILFKKYGHFKFLVVSYLGIFIALKFTDWFSSWYPEKIAKGRI